MHKSWKLSVGLICCLAVLTISCQKTSNVLEIVEADVPLAVEVPIQYAPDAVRLQEKAVRHFMQTQDLEETIALLEQAIAIDPRYDFAFTTQALYLDMHNEWKRAVHVYDRAIALQLGKVQPYLGRAFAHGHLGEKDLAQRDLRAVITLCNRMLQDKAKAEHHAYARSTRAVAVYLYGETQVAIRELEAMLELDPMNDVVRMLIERMQTLPKAQRWNLFDAE